MDYDLLRRMFSVMRLSKVDFPTMIILRKNLEFGQKDKCLYSVEAKFDIEIVIVLERYLLTAEEAVIEYKVGNNNPVPTLHKNSLAVQTLSLKKR